MDKRKLTTKKVKETRLIRSKGLNTSSCVCSMILHYALLYISKRTPLSECPSNVSMPLTANDYALEI